MAKGESSAENITEESKKIKVNNKEEIDFEVEADKFITIFHKVFHEHDQKIIKKKRERLTLNRIP